MKSFFFFLIELFLIALDWITAFTVIATLFSVAFYLVKANIVSFAFDWVGWLYFLGIANLGYSLRKLFLKSHKNGIK